MTLDEVLVGNKVLLTDIKVRDNRFEDKQLQLRFKGLSDVYIPHTHTYYTVPLAKKDAEKLIQELNQPKIGDKPNPFYDYRNTIATVNQYYTIVQIRAPRVVSDDFKDLIISSRFNKETEQKEKYFRLEKKTGDKKRQGKQAFVCEHYNRQARWNIGYDDYFLQPGTLYDVDDPKLVETLKEKRQLELVNFRIHEILKNTVEGNDSKAKTIRSNLISRLRNAFLEHDDTDNAVSVLQRSSYWKHINEPLLASAHELVQREKALQIKIQGYADLRLENKTYKMYLKRRPNFITDRQLNIDEWRGLKYVLLDIETPKFMENDFDITQISAQLVCNGQILESRVYNKTPITKKEIKGSKVFSGYEFDKDMIDAFSYWIVQEGIDVLVAYNNKFDFGHLRTRGEFATGETRESPKMDSNKPFFERFDIPTGFCFDGLRIAQTLLRGFPNSKLESFSRFIYGDEGYHKEISYEEMYELQLLSEGRKVDISDTVKQKLEKYSGMSLENLILEKEKIKNVASEIIVSYVCDDTSTIYDILFGNPLVGNCLSYVQKMANDFKLDFTRLLSSANGMSEVYDRGYFKHVGIHRDDIYPKGIKYFDDEKKRNKKALKDRVNDLLDAQKLPVLNGTYKNVEQRFIPISLLVREYSHHATDKVEDFIKFVDEEFKKDKNPNELIFLSRYANGLLEYVLSDYGNYIRKYSLFDKIRCEMEARLSPTLTKYIDTSRAIAEEILELILKQNYFGAQSDVKITLEELKKVNQSVFKDFKEYKEFKGVMDILSKNLLQIADRESIYRGSSPSNKLKNDILKENNQISKDLREENEDPQNTDFEAPTTLTPKKRKKYSPEVENPFDNNDLFRLFWSFFEHKQALGRVAGGHRIFPNQLESMLKKSTTDLISSLTLTRNIIQTDFPYMYTTEKENIEDEIYFKVTDPTTNYRLSQVQTTMDRIYFSDGKPHFKEFGFYKGIDVKRKPANNTNIFFSNVFKTALDYFLEEKYKEGLQKIIEGDKILQERILRTSKKLPVCEDEITDLIYYNKSRNWYKGIVDGKKQAFALPNAYDFEIDEHGKPFIEMKSDGKKEILPILEDGKGKYFDLIASGKVERVRIQGFENYFPDYTGYLDEYRRKIKGFAKGALIKLAESKNEDDKKVFIEATRLLNAKAGVIPVNANTPKSQTKTKKSRRQSNPNEIQGILNL